MAPTPLFSQALDAPPANSLKPAAEPSRVLEVEVLVVFNKPSHQAHSLSTLLSQLSHTCKLFLATWNISRYTSAVGGHATWTWGPSDRQYVSVSSMVACSVTRK